MVKKKHTSGFTIIELLIAVSILSMLMLVGYYSYSLMLNNWQHKSGQFERQLVDIQRQSILLSALKSTMPWVIVNKNREPFFFFIGSEVSILGITNTGLSDANYPEVYRLLTRESNNTKSLIYQFESTQNILLKTVDQNIEFEQEYIIFDDIDDFTVEYFGWPSLNEKNSGESKQWFSTYSGIDRQLFPSKIKVTVVVGQDKYIYMAEFEKDSAKWLGPYLEDLI